MEESIKMKELLRGRQKQVVSVSTASLEEKIVQSLPPTLSSPTTSTSFEITVNHVDVDSIELPEINDTYGRLSDVIEAVEKVTGFSVIPLTMAKIAPEVVSLQRHEIFTFNGVRFAMSNKPRKDTIEAYQEKIVQNLSTGLGFQENLYVPITYYGASYKTLSLSRVEWTLLLSKFRSYKQKIHTTDDSSLILEISTERV